MIEEKPDALARLANNVAQIPGIGRKTAERIAFHILQMSDGAAESLCSAIADVKKTIRCSVCCNVVDADPCPICADAKRDRAAICVVERPADVRSIERATGFRGLYHVLGGHIAPLDGVHAENLTISRLVTRVSDGSVKEVIVATNPTVEGDLTATYLAQALSGFGLVVSRIAKGVPSGSTLDYATKAVLTDAFSGRRPMRMERKLP